MKAYKLKFADDTFRIVYAKSSLDVIKKYDLATREHLHTRIIELQGEQLAIALYDFDETSDDKS